MLAKSRGSKTSPVTLQRAVQFDVGAWARHNLDPERGLNAFGMDTAASQL